MRGRRAKKIMTVAAVTGISLCLFLSGAAAAFWSPEQAVHVNGNEIENSTLIIGTHLIHMSALTEELYSIAQKSAEDSMQNQMYYKSGLEAPGLISLRRRGWRTFPRRELRWRWRRLTGCIWNITRNRTA